MFPNRDLLGVFNCLAFNRIVFNGHWMSRVRWRTSPAIIESSQAVSIPEATAEEATRPVEQTADTSLPDSYSPSDPAETITQPVYENPKLQAVETAPFEPTVSEQTDQSTENQPQQLPATQSEAGRPTAQRWLNYVNLKLDFNLAQFEQAINLAADDAADGTIDNLNFSALEIGLRADLQAKAKIKETLNISSDDAAKNSAINNRLMAQSRETKAIDVMVAARNFHARMFYGESMALKYKEKQVYADGFLRVSRKLAMRYTQDFSFGFESLQMYNSQAASLDQTGESDQYISNTETLVDNSAVSGDTIGRFFEMVQGYIDDTESNLTDKINSFFDALANRLGIDSEQLAVSRETILNQANSFFDNIDSVFSDISSRYLPSEGEPVEPLLPDESPQAEVLPPSDAEAPQDENQTEPIPA